MNNALLTVKLVVEEHNRQSSFDIGQLVLLTIMIALSYIAGRTKDQLTTIVVALIPCLMWAIMFVIFIA